jgi:muramidase (phage lysozyme)
MADRAFYEQFRNTPEGRALLGVIRYAEGTAKSKDPYRVLFGGSQFSDLSRHPNRVIRTESYPRGSSAAGAYQFKPPTWNQQAQKLGLRSFGPAEQDIAALDLARNRLIDLGGLSYLKQKGLTREALAALAPEWASLPTMEGRSYYGQPVKGASELQKVYQQYYDQPTGATSQSASASTQGKQQPSVKRPAPDYFQGLIRGIQNMFGTTSPSSSSSADAYFDAAMQADAMGQKDTAMALYAKAVESDAIPSARSGGAFNTFASILTPVISEYITAAFTPTETSAVQATASPPPAATNPVTSNQTVGIVDVGKKLEKAGLRVREHPSFGGVGGHTSDSLHYKGLALDITDWQDPQESRASWLPRKTYLAKQFSDILGGSAQVYGPHNDPEGHGEHIHLGLPGGKLTLEQAQRLVNARQEALRRYPLRWAG